MAGLQPCDSNAGILLTYSADNSTLSSSQVYDGIEIGDALEQSLIKLTALHTLGLYGMAQFCILVIF